ncbi:hypothetical protein Leryth_005877 [Lithospermum erythrorhizon]|nr:hypothetical protein Leryth_005877 [Lithospermum erythrorhizon]
MYITRPRSQYRNHRSVVPQHHSEAPSLGSLVVTDEESEELDTSCFGLVKSNSVNSLPFPQDRILKIVHTLQFKEGSNVSKVWFIPVVDQPLSSNRYYIIKASGEHKGKAYTCSRGEEGGACCLNSFSTQKTDLKPRRFNYQDVYQQFEIHRNHNGGFFAQSVAYDGVPPKLLRTKGWQVFVSCSFRLNLQDAQGMISSQLLYLPRLDFPIHAKRSDPIVIGRWYCPVVFMKEETKVSEQMQRSLFYEVTLKQWWEEIYSCENESRSKANIVNVNVNVKRRMVLINGMEAVKGNGKDDDGNVWFKVKECHGKKASVGLCCVMFEKLRSLQERRGWFDRKEIEVKVEGTNEIKIEGKNVWRRFVCYVLVESFVFRRMDGTLLINFNFKNTDRIECRCE